MQSRSRTCFILGVAPRVPAAHHPLRWAESQLTAVTVGIRPYDRPQRITRKYILHGTRANCYLCGWVVWWNFRKIVVVVIKERFDSDQLTEEHWDDLLSHAVIRRLSGVVVMLIWSDAMMVIFTVMISWYLRWYDRNWTVIRLWYLRRCYPDIYGDTIVI